MTSIPAPTPDGGMLVMEVECRTSRAATRSKRHGLTIFPDWSFETPHDLAAERVAAAFGGYTSCLELEGAMAAVRELLGLRARLVPPGVVRHARDDWRIKGVEQCRCSQRKTGWQTAAAAATHAREIEHIAHKHQANLRQTKLVAEGVLQAWGAQVQRPSRNAEARQHVLEYGGLDQMWDAGVHPDRVLEIAALAASAGVWAALPVRFFLSFVYGDIDEEWFSQNLAYVPTVEAATWLAAQTGPHTGTLSGQWLQLGVSPSVVSSLIAVGAAPNDIDAFARAMRRSPRWAIGVVSRWAQVGCRVNLTHLQALAAQGLDASRPPSATAIDDLIARRRTWGTLARADVGVLLALAGGTTPAMRLLDKGVTTVEKYVELGLGG